jgi:glycerol uptake facilitator-like aquaporin
MYGPFFGEFMGTLVLISLGDGAVANVLLKNGSPGAHINPAITLTVAVLSGDWSKVGLFWTAQILGGFAGASLVWLVYLHHRKVTPDPAAKLAVFCTHPPSSASRQPAHRNYCHHLPHRCWPQFREPGRVNHRPSDWFGPVVVGSFGVGPRPGSWRTNRIRDQPRP